MGESGGREQHYFNTDSLSLQEKALSNGMLYGSSATTAYDEVNGQRVHRSGGITPNEFDALVREFRYDPFTRLAFGRGNLLAIMRDTSLPYDTRVDRARRYTDAYLNLVVSLDRQAFPPDDTVKRGIPDYIPEGLSDMGGDAEINPDFRSREKIRINKEEIFEKARPLFHRIFTAQVPEDVSSEQWKQWVVQNVLHYVYTSMPYNYDHSALPRMHGFKSVRLTDVVQDQLAACRHHALMTQVLLQTFGITSRLMKSNLMINGKNLGPHVNNVARIEGQWYLLDSTNPELSLDGKSSKVFMKPLPEKKLDLNTNKYSWIFDLENGEKRGYVSRSNMHYRIRDNVRNPTH